MHLIFADNESSCFRNVHYDFTNVHHNFTNIHYNFTYLFKLSFPNCTENRARIRWLALFFFKCQNKSIVLSGFCFSCRISLFDHIFQLLYVVAQFYIKAKKQQKEHTFSRKPTE